MATIFVMYDLETTKLGAHAEICQIGAISATNPRRVFSTYVMPQGNVTAGASRVNNISKIRGTLYVHGERVRALNLYLALGAFLDYLKTLKYLGNQVNKIILVAHNGRNFDHRILMRSFEDTGHDEDEIGECINGFVDSIPCFQKNFKHFRYFGLSALKDTFGLDPDVAHDALQDSRDLLQVIRQACSEKRISLNKFLLG